MNISIKNDIKKVLIRAIDILEEDKTDVVELKELSNHTIHNASIFQDRDSILIAIVIYSLAKLIARKLDPNESLIQLKNALTGLRNDDYILFRQHVENLLKQISEQDIKLKEHIDEVIKQAEIQKGSTIYAHGISIAVASELLGISQWELMQYIGNTMNYEPEPKMNTKKRMKYTKKLFAK